MGRRDKRHKPGIGGTFTPVLDAEIESTAFKALSGSGVKVFIFFKRLHRQLQHKSGDERTDICLSIFPRKKKWHVGEYVSDGSRDLWEKGFVSVISIWRHFTGCRPYQLARARWLHYWKTYGEQWSDRRKFEPDPVYG